MTYHRLQTKKGDRFYHEAGAGEPIVLWNRSSGSSAAWLPVMSHLDAGHMSPLTHPADVAEAILGHVESINPQRRSAA